MIDPTKITPEKLAEMNDSLIVDNQYLRGELNAARARLAGTGQTPVFQFEQQYQRSDGYWKCKHGGVWDYRHRIVWRLTHGPIPDGMQIDHMNGVRGDDYPSNLQAVTNQANCRLGSHELKAVNTSGVNCVNLNRCGRWYGQFRHNGKRVYCGSHSTRAEAEAAVLSKREELDAPTRRVA